MHYMFYPEIIFEKVKIYNEEELAFMKNKMIVMLPNKSISRERKVIEIKPKPLQNCWYGEKHVDIASICEYFEDSSVWWSKVYYGNEYRFVNDEFIDSIEIIDDNDLSYEMQEESRELDKYYYEGLLYLH